MTQTEHIRAHLQAGQDITPLEALDRYGCFRLASRIAELRAEGLDVQTLTDRQNGKAYARYRLVGQLPLLA
jgi:hypothetical protein